MPLELRPSRRTLICALAACFSVFVLLGVAGAGSAQAAPTPNTALILGSTVDACSATDNTGGICTDTRSLEQQQAEAAGFTVTVVTDSQWDSMTTADFANYQLIIFGDPAQYSGNTMGPGSVAALTAPVWEPAVMNSGGNKVLLGATPTKHSLQKSAPDAPELEEQSLAYAGAASGATGVYVDLNAAYDGAVQGTAVPFLDGLSTQTGTNKFQVMGYDPNPPPALFNSATACDTGVNIVATTPLTTGLTDTSLGGWKCSVHEAFTAFPSDYTPLVLAPSSSGFPSEYCANDVDTSQQACGSPYILVSGGGVTLSSEIGLSPTSQNIPTSPTSPGSGTVTASVTNGGVQQPGVSVTFTVTSGPDQGQTATVVTDSTGQAQFTVNNSGVAGYDSITASFTDSGGSVQKAVASINFQGPPNVTATANNLTGTEGTALGNPVVASFTDPSGSIGASGWTAQVNWGDGTSASTGSVSSTGTANQYNVNADHTYASPGTYTVTITIADTGNSADTTTVTATATIGQAQLAVTAQAVSATEGSNFSGQVATFTNSDHSTSATNYTATINWGDGSSATAGTVAAVGGTPGAFTVADSHQYADAGSYTVTVTIAGTSPTTSGNNTSTATISEATISVSAGSITATTGTPFSGQVATFTDANPLTPASQYTATIEWGDGSSSPGTVSGSGGSFTVTGSHTYATSGSFPLTVKVAETDDPSASGTGNGSSNTSDASFTVTGRGSVMLPSETFTGTLATVTYGSASAPASSFSAQINWGDGSTGAGTVSGSAGSFTVTANHTFTGTGPYSVKVTVTDPATKTGSATDTILIPSSVSALSIPGRISARALLCGVKRHSQCTGLPILGSFRSGGGAVWDVAIFKAGGQPTVLGQITRKVTAGSVKLVYKVTNHKLAKHLYKMVRHHRLNQLSVQQVFTNAAGASSRTTLFSRVTR